MSAPVSTADPFGRSSSGSTAFRMTTSDIIREAFAICQIGIEGETLSADQFENGRRSLNILLTSFLNQGLHLWTYSEGIVFLEAGKNNYTLEQVRATDYYTKTELTTDALTAATTVTVSTTELELGQEVTDFLDADWWIGFLKEDCNIFWTQVTSVSGNDVTIDDGLPEDMDSGTQLVFYRDQIDSVDRIFNDSVRRLDGFWSSTGPNTTPLFSLSHKRFFDLPTQDSLGQVSQTYYQRSLPQGTLWTWQTPADSTYPLTFTYERKIDDFVNNDDCADMPKSWLEAVTYNLADRLKIKYRVPQQLSMEIKEIAIRSLSDALAFDNENTDLEISLNGGR